jgi:hypothetical protein
MSTAYLTYLCTENVIRFDLLIESLNGDGRANILVFIP